MFLFKKQKSNDLEYNLNEQCLVCKKIMNKFYILKGIKMMENINFYVMQKRYIVMQILKLLNLKML